MKSNSYQDYIRDDFPLVVSERLILRMLEPQESKLALSYHLKNRDYLEEFYPVYPSDFFTESFWQEQLRANIAEFKSDKSLRLFIFEKVNEDTVIGTVNFSNFVRRAAQYCNVGYGIDEQMQGKGYMTEALVAAVDYVFSTLNLHRIMANYMPTNEKSSRVLKKAGFVVEGYARDYLYLNGAWRDHILTSITNRDWKGEK